MAALERRDRPLAETLEALALLAVAGGDLSLRDRCAGGTPAGARGRHEGSEGDERADVCVRARGQSRGHAAALGGRQRPGGCVRRPAGAGRGPQRAQQRHDCERACTHLCSPALTKPRAPQRANCRWTCWRRGASSREVGHQSGTACRHARTQRPWRCWSPSSAPGMRIESAVPSAKSQAGARCLGGVSAAEPAVRSGQRRQQLQGLPRSLAPQLLLCGRGGERGCAAARAMGS
jgi:hypothetical protein